MHHQRRLSVAVFCEHDADVEPPLLVSGLDSDVEITSDAPAAGVGQDGAVRLTVRVGEEPIAPDDFMTRAADSESTFLRSVTSLTRCITSGDFPSLSSASTMLTFSHRCSSPALILTSKSRVVRRRRALDRTGQFG
ncbi:MAG: hypothetical protein DRI30_08690 [Chloroflexi bacterium]|nr:MAG: hypothetical protein DRI30_08690 [Chloroflexota bacterium]